LAEDVSSQWCCIFSPHFTSASADVICYFANKHIQIITWSQLIQPSFVKQSILCTKQDLRKDHSISLNFSSVLFSNNRQSSYFSLHCHHLILLVRLINFKGWRMYFKTSEQTLLYLVLIMRLTVWCDGQYNWNSQPASTAKITHPLQLQMVACLWQWNTSEHYRFFFFSAAGSGLWKKMI